MQFLRYHADGLYQPRLRGIISDLDQAVSYQGTAFPPRGQNILVFTAFEQSMNIYMGSRRRIPALGNLVFGTLAEI